MLKAEENELLTRTGPGTPMGALFRRYWLPVLLAEELPEPDGEPKAVRLLGEDLVAFRDTRGQVGLLGAHCAHRGAPLAYGRNEECGLRCLYHGWKYDVAGRVVDMPNVAAGSTYAERVRHTAYPTREVAGVVWAYLGPPEQEPPFRAWEWTHAPAERLGVYKILESCNWAQGIEGTIDTTHTDFLHSADVRGRPRDHAPILETQDTAYGFRYAAIRQPDTDADRTQYVRVSVFALPCFAMFPPLRGRGVRGMDASDEVIVQQAFVPIDDEHTWFYSFAYSRRGPLPAYWRNYPREFGLQGNVGVPAGNRANKHLQDYAALKTESWSGIQGVNCQDFAMAEGMGPILDRTREHLVPADTAVITFRRLMLQQARALAAGATPRGLGADVPWERLASDERTIPREQPWQAVGAFAGEPVPTA
ncbi:MAG TPA: Rieske 2Fe-2S domain-containing protein [Chloroflexota bacterium]|nr:Rieske 2Fe-2S domain-containing protein [Chloroflexota bacterium]